MQPWLPLPLSALLLGLAPPLAAQGRPHQNACGVLHFVGTTVCPPGFVQPVDWYSGDTHEHIQHCFTPTDDTPLEIYQEMLADQLDLSNALIWGAGFITPDQFKAYVQQFLTGAEDPVTAADPTKILQFGVETSGVSAGNLGHMIGLNITPAEADVFQLQLGCGPYYPAVGWKNDGSGDYSEPVLDLFRQAPKAVTGYAHQSWPVDLYADVFAGGWDWEDPTLPSYVGTDAKCSFGMDLAFPIPKTCGNTHPVLAPFDVALGRIDFLEGFDLLEPTCGGPLEKRYFGMYYKLLNAGQFVALSAGTDADCIDTGCEPRTWVRLEPGEAFTYDAWTQGLKEGRTSVSYGAYQFLEMTVDDVPVGERLNLSGTPTVKVKATYHVDLQDGSTVSDTIEIVQDGAVVASESFGPLGMGSHTFEVDVPVQRSGWIAARTASYGTHTSTVHTFVDKTPVANCADAEYWALYADFLNAQLDVAAATGPGALEFYAGCSELEIRDYAARGRRIFAAVRDYDLAPPVGVTRVGWSSPSSCGSLPAMVTDDTPVAGAPFSLRYFNAPPGAVGGLVYSATALPVGLPLLGAEFFVQLNPTLAPLPTMADEGGFGEIAVAALPPIAGTQVTVQCAWLNPSGCTDAGLLSASDALTIVIQP